MIQKQKILFITLVCCLVVGLNTSKAQDNFEKYFSSQSLRIDFEIGGNATYEMAFLKKLRKEPYWGGNPASLLPKQDLGDYRLTIKDRGGKLLFVKGFNSLFREWQTRSEAREVNRSFAHALQIPFPTKKVVAQVESRQKDGKFKLLLNFSIDPDSYLIESAFVEPYSIDTVRYVGSSSKNLDIVFIAEGYTISEMQKFKADVRRFEKYIFDVYPFSEYRERSNIFAILSISVQSGTDVPTKGMYLNTLLNASFYTFGIDRYLTVGNTEKMFDVASLVPYDNVFVLVNTQKYGGSGFYNHYTCCASDCRSAEEISSHELGHGLIGLADEYFGNPGDVGYFYHLNKEPWEMNITTLKKKPIKWASMVTPNTPIPTPRIETLKKAVGAFEGAAYTAKGIYAPMQDCKMKSNIEKKLCPVCVQATKQVIDSYVK